MKSCSACGIASVFHRVAHFTGQLLSTLPTLVPKAIQHVLLMQETKFVFIGQAPVRKQEWNRWLFLNNRKPLRVFHTAHKPPRLEEGC